MDKKSRSKTSFFHKGHKKDKKAATLPPGAGFQDVGNGVSQLSLSECDEQFEQLLDDLNLSEEKKAPLRKKNIEEKRSMLMMHKNAERIDKEDTDNPQTFITKLRDLEIVGEDRIELFKSLKVLLTHKPVRWIRDFGDEGLNVLLKNLIQCCNKKEERGARNECLKCLKAFMNNKFGLHTVVNCPDSLSIMCRCLDASDPETMLQCVNILAALCICSDPSNGHEKVLEGLSVSAEMNVQNRFDNIIVGLGIRVHQGLQVGCMQLINAIICTPEELDFRLHLRNEFMRCGMQDLIVSLDHQDDDDLQTQLHIFHNQQEEDHEELLHKYEVTQIDFANVEQCISVIHNSVRETEAEKFFLSILQHMLCIRDDHYVRPEYYRLIDECVSQIILRKDGLDPDFRHTKRFDMKFEKLINDLSERGKEVSELEKKLSEIEPELESIPKLESQLEAALISKQEMEAKAQLTEEQIKKKLETAVTEKESTEEKLVTIQNELLSAKEEFDKTRNETDARIGELEKQNSEKDKEISELTEKMKNGLVKQVIVPVEPKNIQSHTASTQTDPLAESSTVKNPAAPSTPQTNIPPPPPPPGLPAPPPPPPPPGGIPPPPPPPPPPPGGIPPPPPPPPPPGGIPPPPPPPPPPGGIPPPPPPPPPPGGIPPPPPPPGGIPPPPPPPGGGPPPPPPPPGGIPPPMAMAAPVVPALPHGMKEKKKYTVEVQTKRINWKKVPTQIIKEDSFWVKAKEDKFEDESLFQSLVESFGVKKVVKKAEEDKGTEEKKAKKTKDLKILDGKAALNLSMLLGSIKSPYPKIKQWILEIDEKRLNTGMLEMMSKYLPEADQMIEFAALKDEYDDLAEPEQFLVTMSDIKRLKPRLQSIHFKMSFSEIVNGIKPDLVSATVALEEIKSSTKFASILELILLLGNYLNSGSRNAQSFGFDISFLAKLKNTKAQDNKTTLVHFLVNIIEEKYEGLIQFTDDLTQLDKASKVSEETLQTNLRTMEKSLKQLDLDIQNCTKLQMEGDKFADVMQIFIDSAKDQSDVLNNMLKKMTSLFDDMGRFYAFDPKKYTMEEFFGDIKAFKDSFLQALKENAQKRETNARLQRAKEAKEKAQREKEEKIARLKERENAKNDGKSRGKVGGEFGPKDDDLKGAMDNLLDALKTGSAFNTGRRKREKPKGRRGDDVSRTAQIDIMAMQM